VRNCLIPDPYPGDAAFWKKVGASGVSLGNSMFLCSASGRVVDGFNDRFLEIWLNNWARLRPEDRQPNNFRLEERGNYRADPRNPKFPDGAISIRTFMRALDRDDGGSFFAPATLSLGISKTVVRAEPNRDFLWLRSAEWKSLVPADPQPGGRYPVPASIRERIFRFHLVDGACCLPGFHRRDEISGSLGINCVERSSEQIRLELSGDAQVGAGDERIEFDLAGELSYRPEAARFTRFDAVALSRTACHRDAANGKLLWLAIAFELGQAGRPADCRAPYRVWYDEAGFGDYFGG
jgi:hypothetical protein